MLQRRLKEAESLQSSRCSLSEHHCKQYHYREVWKQERCQDGGNSLYLPSLFVLLERSFTFSVPPHRRPPRSPSPLAACFPDVQTRSFLRYPTPRTLQGCSEWNQYTQQRRTVSDFLFYPIRRNKGHQIKGRERTGAAHPPTPTLQAKRGQRQQRPSTAKSSSKDWVSVGALWVGLGSLRLIFDLSQGEDLFPEAVSPCLTPRDSFSFQAPE